MKMTRSKFFKALPFVAGLPLLAKGNLRESGNASGEFRLGKEDIRFEIVETTTHRTIYFYFVIEGKELSYLSRFSCTSALHRKVFHWEYVAADSVGAFVDFYSRKYTVAGLKGSMPGAIQIIQSINASNKIRKAAQYV
jgi:hypothetical protein